jgi:hypothetical protein
VSSLKKNMLVISLDIKLHLCFRVQDCSLILDPHWCETGCSWPASWLLIASLLAAYLKKLAIFYKAQVEIYLKNPFSKGNL